MICPRCPHCKRPAGGCCVVNGFVRAGLRSLPYDIRAWVQGAVIWHDGQLSGDNAPAIEAALVRVYEVAGIPYTLEGRT